MTRNAESVRPRWRNIRLDPGNVVVGCTVCDQRIYGVTAADTLAMIDLHYAAEHARIDGSGSTDQ